MVVEDWRALVVEDWRALVVEDWRALVVEDWRALVVGDWRALVVGDRRPSRPAALFTARGPGAAGPNGRLLTAGRTAAGRRPWPGGGGCSGPAPSAVLRRRAP
ncbi:hypothetical protein ACIO8F_20265 [Streptomyces sp. NPDC087228]|uniref:hypothetical protein n=1 Tax=Streptomyces sp. NPDC087228 TaxID=3365772 RepID=UPI00380882F7